MLKRLKKLSNRLVLEHLVSDSTARQRGTGKSRKISALSLRQPYTMKKYRKGYLKIELIQNGRDYGLRTDSWRREAPRAMRQAEKLSAGVVPV